MCSHPMKKKADTRSAPTLKRGACIADPLILMFFSSFEFDPKNKIQPQPNKDSVFGNICIAGSDTNHSNNTEQNVPNYEKPLPK